MMSWAVTQNYLQGHNLIYSLEYSLFLFLHQLDMRNYNNWEKHNI